MSLTMHTAAERPDLWERGIESATVWPEYNLHGDILNQWWGHLDRELPDYQFVLYDDDVDEVVAEGHTGPFRWDGDPQSLPPGIDAVLELIFTQDRAGDTPNTLCALAAETPRKNQARGMATQLLTAMRTIATRQRLLHLVAPVRPSLKDRYPLTRIERYITWRRSDHQLFDPWMRVHERLGARVATPVPQSMLITGTVEDWERWTSMAFPESGDYTFPEGLATLAIDRESNRGTYWEPNVWMIHPDIGP
jgi:hypothetical protein